MRPPTLVLETAFQEEDIQVKMHLFAGLVTLVLTIIGAAFSFQRACPIDPIAVDLGTRPEAKGFWSHEFNLENLEKIVVGPGPEDLAFDSQGRVYTGTDDGWIKRIGVDGTVENYTYVGGSVLGLALGPKEEVYFIDPDQGLFKVSNDGIANLLSNEVDGKEILLADGVVVAKDGTVYFTDASTKFSYKGPYMLNVIEGRLNRRFIKYNMLNLIEGRPNGRLLKYNPSTNRTSILIKDMGFANGVALSEDEEFLLICETSRARIMRFWLKGEKDGTLDTFIDRLPAFPDNVRRSESDGNFYIGLVGKRTSILDWALKTPAKLLRCLIADPIVFNLVSDSHGALLVVVSPEGKLVSKYEDFGRMINFVTGGSRLGDSIYFSGLGQNYLGRLQL